MLIENYIVCLPLHVHRFMCVSSASRWHGAVYVAPGSGLPTFVMRVNTIAGPQTYSGGVLRVRCFFYARKKCGVL